MNQVLGSNGLAWGVTTNELATQVEEQLTQQSDQETIYDAIVIGVGSMGSSTCYHLAKQGYKVLGLEQFTIPHELGSHTGQSRIIRKAYFEHPNYVPLLHKAYANWKSLEEENGHQLYFKTGLLYFGPEEHLLIKGTKESAAKYSIDINEFTSEEQQDQFPQFSIPSDYSHLLEPDAGFISPERAILTYTSQALKHGAIIHSNEKTLEWKRENSAITVKTDKRTYRCKKLILTAGAWAQDFTSIQTLRVTRQTIFWAAPKKPKAFELEQLPCWTIADPAVSGFYYGFPILPEAFGEPVGFKFAHHTLGEPSNPDTVKRHVTKEEEEMIVSAIRHFLPDGTGSIQQSKICLYTSSPDDHFILDFHPDNEDVVIAAGFSGHGFKFASVIGEILSQLAMEGKTSQPIEFLRADRFQ